jgi:acetyltransferase-like isoleucine patch superfamily enzyme
MLTLGHLLGCKRRSGAWIGGGAIILKGVTVGCGSVIAAGTVVNKDIPPYSVVAGVPGMLVKWWNKMNVEG